MEAVQTRDTAGLCRLGAVSALAIVAIYAIEMVVIFLFGLPPTSVDSWFAALQANPAAGLVRTFALDVVAVAFHIPLYLAFYFYLRSTRKGSLTLLLAVLFAWIGVAIYLATNVTFGMHFLSQQYAQAGSGEQKTAILAAAQALFAQYYGTGPFAAYFLYAVSGILVSIVMVQSERFPKWVAFAGIVGNALELGLPPSIDPPFFLQIDPLLIAIGGVILIGWYIAVAVQFIKAAPAA